MELTDFFSNDSSKIIKNGVFQNLGHIGVNNIDNLLTFCDSSKFVKTALENDHITCIITLPEFVDAFVPKNIGIISSNNPRIDFFKVHNKSSLTIPKFKTRIGKNTIIKQPSLIANENVVIGDNCYIEEGVIIRENVSISDDVILRAGTIIGGQGFQFSKSPNEVLKIIHFGQVNIEENVEIKELCTIHPALFNWDSTYIGKDTKIDAHSHIGHANKIGNRVFICSHVNISGNSIVEDDCYVGPGVNIPNRLRIGNNAKLSVGATVTKDVSDHQTVSGNFAVPHDTYLEHIKSLLKNSKNDE